MPGTVVISVDAELGWGFHDLDDPPTGRLESGRRGWKKLIELFDFFEIPATWGVVGHLFLDSCDGVHMGHPLSPEWFSHERTGWHHRPDLRFGGDLILDLIASPIDHEIACHTFSHVVFDDDVISEEVARTELATAAEAAKGYGVTFDSIIFPRNVPGFRNQLAEAGYLAYRGGLLDPSLGPRAFIRKLRGALDPNRTNPVIPTIDEHGLVNVPPSQYLFGVQGVPRRTIETVWNDPVVERAKNGIDKAGAESLTYHLWLHPNNLMSQRDDERLRAILDYVDKSRRTGDVAVKTIATIANQLL